MAVNFAIKEIKKAFFDAAKIQKQMTRIEKRALSKMGAFVRRTAKSSIKKAPKVDAATGLVTRKRKGIKTKDAVSRPGQPPYSHVGHYKRLIFFAYDAATRSVVIGPALFGKGAAKSIEHGGPITIKERKPVARLNPKTKRKATGAQKESYIRLVKEGRIPGRPKPEFVTRAARMAARPAMRPAGLKEARKFPEVLRSVAK